MTCFACQWCALTVDSCGCNCNHPPPSWPLPSQSAQSGRPCNLHMDQQMLLSVLVFAHFSWMPNASLFVFFFCYLLHLHLRPLKATYVLFIFYLESTWTITDFESVVPFAGAMLVLLVSEWKGKKTISQCSTKWQNAAWGRHMGIHWLLLSLGDTPTLLLNPLR